MKCGMGWMYIKDYCYFSVVMKIMYVDEEVFKYFVFVDVGDSGYEVILCDFCEFILILMRKFIKCGIFGVFLDLELYVKGGG